MDITQNLQVGKRVIEAYTKFVEVHVHTIAGAIMGVGATKRFSAVRWGIAGTMVWAWILTIPMSALVPAGAYWLIGTIRVVFG